MKKLHFLAISCLTAAAAITASAQEAAPRFTPPTYHVQRSTLFEVLPTDTTDIVMLGNSITDGCEWSELLGDPRIKNRGISGDVTEGVLCRLTPIVKGQPAKVFMLIGINDLSRGYTPDSITTRIFRIVETIKTGSPRTQVYVQSLLPLNPSLKMFQSHMEHVAEIPIINSRLASEADNRGYTFINLYPSFVNSEGLLDTAYTNDGLHLLGQGYLLWRELITPYLD